MTCISTIFGVSDMAFWLQSLRGVIVRLCWRAVSFSEKQCDGGEDGGTAENIQPGSRAAGGLLQIAKYRRREESAEITQRVDQRNAQRDDRRRQLALRDRPEQHSAGFRADA